MKPEAGKVARVLKVLDVRYPGKGMMDFGNPEDTLIATLLSARTTDVQVLRVYPALRKRYPTLKALAKADVREMGTIIKSIGFYNAKARSVKKLANVLLDEFGGRVPRTMEELVRLPGVGRKTASCVLTYAFKIPAIAVDTHVFRIVHRLGWAKGKNAVEVEKELRTLIPEKYWIGVNRSLVQFGRDVCRAPKPQCWRCPVAKWCAYPNKTVSSSHDR
ncbi:endonuclease III [Patescibacteria group bacterium]|jgi:endonuclease-3|nr:endonuclease III [Patescibacteria group bacterium]